jgi:hypothetical protein
VNDSIEMPEQAPPRLGADYYVSPDGDDANDGTSSGAAWRTLAHVNRVSFTPGDRILLQGDQVFDGNLLFSADGRGTANDPIILTSYGPGKATIRVSSGHGVKVHNAGAFWISNLILIGGVSGMVDTYSGVAFHNDLPGDIRLPGIRIENVEVSGFAGNGIELGGLSGKSGYSDVRIEHVVVHDNAQNGINIFGEWDQYSYGYAHTNVCIRHALAYNNSGVPGPARSHSGSGIIMSDVNFGIIEQCIAYNNGCMSNSSEGGPVGIWAHDSNDVRIQYNESYSNRTDGKFDGGGFDLDGGVSNSILQYNYSHDNDGAGFMLAQYPSARPSLNNIIRYNVSLNDGRKNSYGAIHLFGVFGRTEIHSNNIYLDSTERGRPAGICFQEGTRALVHVWDNSIHTGHGVPAVRVESTTEDLLFHGNRYLPTGSPSKLQRMASRLRESG